MHKPQAHPLTAQIHALRLQGRTQQDIAQALGLRQPQVSRILNLETHRKNERESNRRYSARKNIALVDLTEQGYKAWVKQQSRA